MCASKPRMPATPAAPPPTEELKNVTADAAASRDQVMRRLANRLTLSRTNTTSGLGLTSAATVQQKTLLGQ